MTRTPSVLETFTIHIAFRPVKRGGRKEMHLPDVTAQARKPDNTLALAFRWKRTIDSGEFANIAELAEREGITAPYLTRTKRLAQLAPDLIEEILDDRQRHDLTLEALRGQIPDESSKQL